MKLRILITGLAISVLTAGVALAASLHEVKPNEYDPVKTLLVQAAWLRGIGCPTDAKTAEYGPAPEYKVVRGAQYTDPACATGDSEDDHNAGLLLAKTGPTTNVASAYAVLEGVKGLALSELGYDIRKPGSPDDARGSHCGNGAPRFNVETNTGFFFVGCNSPAPAVTASSAGWLRLRWDAAALAAAGVSGTVKSITILFDEGQDTGPDNFGLAVLDNIDVNGTLVGRGTTDAD